MAHHVVIIGGGYAGIMAAQRLGAAEVTLISDRTTFSERIRLHQMAAGEGRIERSIPALLRRKGVTFVHGRVTRIDPTAGRVSYTTPAGDLAEVSYDSLIYALGSKTGNPPNPRAYTLDPGSAHQLAARLRELPPGAHVAIIGGGLTGIEAATEIAETYPRLRVRLVTRGAFGEHLSPKGRAYLYAAFARLNIEICDHLTVESMGDGELLTDRGVLPYDACVWTAGFTVPPLAREAGLAVNECGQIVVDRCLRSVSHPNIYAAGDAAWIADFPFTIRMACATALPMGGHAAENISAKIAGKPEKTFEFRYYWRCLSLGRGDGLVQMVNADDTPRDQIITGKGGAVFKEMICRMTINVLRLERHMPGLYRVPA